MAGKKGTRHGFAAWAETEPEALREIASKGGLAAKNNPNTHRFKVGSQEAREAGRRGGTANRRTKSA